jgi:hypothetical protein
VGSGVDCTPLGAQCIKGLCETGLIAYWAFDEGTGTVAADATGNGNDGTVTGGQWVTRDTNGALQLGANASYVEVGDKLDTVDLPFSVAAWVRVGAAGANTNILFESDADAPVHSGIWVLRVSSGEWEVGFGDGTDNNATARRSLATNAPLPQGTWIHIAAVVEGPTTMRLYQDGAEVPGTLSGTGGALVVHRADPFHIGSSALGNSWDGNIDELRIYERPLSASEIATIAAL